MTIAVEADAYSDKELEEMVDEDIANFDTFFQGLGNDPLSLFEKAAVKTYLHWKTHGAQQAPVHGKTDGESNGTKTGS